MFGKPILATLQEIGQKLKEEKENAESATAPKAGGDEDGQSPKSGESRSGAPAGEANSTTALDQQQPASAEQPVQGKAEGAESVDPSGDGKSDIRDHEQADQGQTSTPGEQGHLGENTATGEHVSLVGDDVHPAEHVVETVRGDDPSVDPSLSGDAGGQESSYTPRRQFGGNFLPKIPHWVDPANLRRAQRALKRLVDQDNDGLDTSPRLDGRALATELISQRLNLSRCRRQEMARRRFLIAVDVSGSCSSQCGEMFYAAQTLAKADPRIVLWIHSNGYIQTLVVDGKDLEFDQGGDSSVLITVFRSLNITRSLLLGDWDASWIYQQLEESGTRLLWAWNFGCNNTGPHRRDVRKVCPDMTWRNADDIQYWEGVSSLGDVLSVIENAKNLTLRRE
jgi:hypothetical protein